MTALDRLAALSRAKNGILAIFNRPAYNLLAGPKAAPHLLTDREGDGGRAWTEHAEAIKKGTDELAQASHKLAEAVYAKKEGAEGEAAAGAEQAGAAKPKDDKVVDADFEEVKEEKK